MTLLRRPTETELSPPSSPRHHVSITNGRNSSSLRSVGLDYIPVKITAPVKNAHHDSNIESLIEKMKSGLEVCWISVKLFVYLYPTVNVPLAYSLPRGSFSLTEMEN